MSAYSTDDYEFSFAQRTIKNLEFIQSRVKEERHQGKKDYEIQDAFEVTQLINSFVGLLIIPRQMCFKFLPDNAKFPEGSEAEKLFDRIRTDSTLCEDTYKKQVYDRDIRYPLPERRLDLLKAFQSAVLYKVPDS